MTKKKILFQFSLLVLLQLLGCSVGIRLLDVVIPPHAIRGKDVRLKCNYDMEGDKLYSIKWYRNGHEFYRFIPSDNPRTTFFNGNGINIDERKSSETDIYLRNVEVNTTGEFRCEVSGEAPLFQTAHNEAIMAVVDPPKDGPVISGAFPRYHIGDRVDVNCTSYRSIPSAKLKWYINGEQADRKHVIRYKVITDENGLKTSVLGLNFKVRDKHFKLGDLKLKCTASIASIYWRSNEESVQGVRPQSALVSESRSSRNSGRATHFIDAVGSASAGLHHLNRKSSSRFLFLFFFAISLSMAAINL